MCAGVNAHYASELIMVCSTTKENAIALGFNSIYIDGISFNKSLTFLTTQQC
jgi:hypothetical protein